MKVTTSKSKNSESFYIAKSYINNKGKSTSVNVRKLSNIKKNGRQKLFLSLFTPIRNLIMTNRFCIVAGTFFHKLSITDFKWIKPAVN